MPEPVLRACALLCALGAILLSPRTSRSQDPLDQVLRSLSAVPGVEARFHEDKHIALLAEPIINEGVLYFLPPSQLVRRTLRPRRSTLRIDGDHLVMQDESGRRRIDLSSSPALRSFVDCFVGLFSGDRATLQRSYRLRARAVDASAWEIVMHPRPGPIRRAIREIRARGRGATVERVVVAQRNGDLSETTFSQIDVRRRFLPSEIRSIFEHR